ncbi:hypothetical protein FRB95_002056 [Tulasnella sp. JGI-2019a]|nr:hypothetical protein FRB95_002056 [Tulasnella sp. JGI-2019a]
MENQWQTNTSDVLEFGHIREFWSRYDKLTDDIDRAMLGRLNQNLDVLLIFAGLFSGINTAFIVLTLSSLSAPPLNQTNTLLTLLVLHADNSTLTSKDINPPFIVDHAAVRQNCTFIASLCSSILAAVGAVLAKR